MPAYGGHSPYPRRYGGGTPPVEYVRRALSQGRGKALDGETYTSTVAIENRAIARAIVAAWGTNERLGNQFIAQTMTSMLPRWERIFGLTPLPTDPPATRCAAVDLKLSQLGKSATPQQVTDDLTAIAPGVFVTIAPTTSAEGPAYFPGSAFANPYDLAGTTTTGVSLVDWWSNVSHIAVQVQQPAGMSRVLYKQYVAAIGAYLDGALPAWCTFATFQLAHSAALGFWLDEPNLGLEAFD